MKVEFVIELADATTFDRIMIQEPITFGQRISKFQILVENEDKGWDIISAETTIGYKRLLRVEPTTSARIKIRLLEANNTPAIANFGLYLSSRRE